jgi:hypothetical protein
MDQSAVDALKIYQNYRDQRAKHFEEVEIDRGFVLNNQWTDAEATELEERGHSPLVINRIFPVIMQEIAIMTAKNVEFRVLAREDGDVRVAKIGNDLMSYIQDRNNFPLLFSKIIYDFLVPGSGYALVYQDAYTFEGMEVGIDHIPFEDVFADPYAKRQDLYDAENILVSKLITGGQFQRIFPDKSEALKQAQQDWESGQYVSTGLYNQGNITQSKDIYDPDRDLYRIIERYSYSKIKKVKIVETARGATKLYLPEEFEQIKGQKAVQQAISAGAYNVTEVWDDQSYLETSLGGAVVYSKTALPSRRIPVIPFMNLHHGTPYSIGDVRFLRGIQKEINKRRSLLIAHATTSTASKLLVEKGAIDDIEEAERKNARPGAIIEYNTGYNVPQQNIPVPLPNGLFQLEGEAKYDLEYLAGMFAISQGSTRDAPETFRATLAIEEFANRRLNLKMRSVTNSLSIMGSVAWEYMQKSYNYDKVVRIVKPDSSEQEIKLGLVDDPQEADIRKVFNVTTGTYDVKAVGGSTMASNRWAELQEYKELLQMGAIDQPEFLKKTNIFDKEGILQRSGQLQQAQNQLEQMAQMLEDSQKEISQRDAKLESSFQTIIKQKIEIQELKKSNRSAETANEGE